MSFRFWYQKDIVEAKEVFGKDFTCKIETAPHGEEFEIAVIRKEDLDEKWDNVQICLVQYLVCFMLVYLRKGKRRVLRIGTRSGAVKELWDMVSPIVELESKGEIGFESFDDEVALKAEMEADEAAAESDAQAQAEAEVQAAADMERDRAAEMAEAEAAVAEAEAQAMADAEADEYHEDYEGRVKA